MTQSGIRVTVIGESQHELEELEEASRQLQDELREVDGVGFEAVPDDPPRDPTRSIAEMLAAFTLVALYGVRPLVRDFGPHVVRVIEDWTQRHRDKQVLVTFPDGSKYEINGHGSAETRELIDRIDQTMRSSGD